MEKKRNRLQIIHDILRVIRERNGRIKPTHILYKSNLSHQMMMEYLEELKQKEFILEIKKEKGKTYVITPKGEKYLSEYSAIKEFANSFGLS
ncbi:Winged helix-turn-helix [uncultured archaeon]|nr:Winged helix-turn-helix [uncultured archaeon]